MKIEDFLINHTIIKIGHSLSGYVCCETIVDNPKELTTIVRENNCHISEIRWWDRVEISTGSSIGYGGPRDPRNPNIYFFAETDIYKSFNGICEDDEEYYSYFKQVRTLYPNFDLYPSFDVKKGRGKTGDGKTGDTSLS